LFLFRSVGLAGAKNLGSGCRVKGRRSRSRSGATHGSALEAAAASWRIRSEEDDVPVLLVPIRPTDLSKPGGWAARLRERAIKAERGAGSAAAASRSGAALDL
jgi:hypothetical protein